MRCLQFSVLYVLTAMPFANFATPLPPPWHDIRVKHTWNVVPPNWEALGHPPAGTTIDLHVALKPHHENALVDTLYKVSDPRSPKYGAHLSKEQVAQLVAPHPDTLDLINTWLRHHTVPSSSISTTHGGSWLKLTGIPVSQANELLGASYQVYRRIGTNDSTILRTVGYGLPSVLHSHVQTVIPTTYFASTGALRQTPRSRTVGETANMATRERVTSLSSREVEVNPSVLRWLYQTAEYVPAAADRNVLAVTGYLDSYPSQADLTEFMSECREDAIGATFEVVQINGGGYDPSRPDAEANLNLQYTQAIAFPTPHIFYSTGGGISINHDDNTPASDDAWLQWVNYMLDSEDIPQTINTSYGDPETHLPPEYAETLCGLYARLGARGASVIFSSGNYGVGKGDCLANDGSGVHFIPAFPASCPFVTSVGGTIDIPESAAPFSGGGFSNYFSQPPYQSVAVPAFLRQLGDKYDGYYNAEGRGFPDISAQAFNFFIIDNNESYSVDGTSCSAPTVAGIISLLNDYLLATNRRPLGFLNPWLYGIGIDGLNDITSGSNPGCGTDGFTAIVGWDPVTGLGTPDFSRLQSTLASFPR
ncbi:subtilisin-like protein [Lactarius akahatsu]|uniref:tripeptidyl-peptidase II n=1 Tax=Lactarius akahatsu TaxID=416441 RepID=A0AAD4L515_9AGAM|nr:subtilisin-like protein [Lactarius akahatsu]